jgi:hypothetical protein
MLPPKKRLASHLAGDDSSDLKQPVKVRMKACNHPFQHPALLVAVKEVHIASNQSSSYIRHLFHLMRHRRVAVPCDAVAALVMTVPTLFW